MDSAIFPADLAVPAELDALIGQVKDRFGRAPDALVNSASIISEGQWADLSREELGRHLDVNFIAPMLLTRAFAGALATGQVGAVVNILDQKLHNPNPDYFSYTLTKAALAHAL